MQTPFPHRNLRMTAPNVVWLGTSGKRYEFANNAIGAALPAVAGVYIFCRLIGDQWFAVYVGETENLSRRLNLELDHHHRWPCIKAAGASHVCTLPVRGNYLRRLAVETDLRTNLNPQCNRQ